MPNISINCLLDGKEQGGDFNMSATILVVDDRVGIRRLLQEVLLGAGYKVLTSGGKEAMEITRQNNVDMVLLDMKMSGMDGLETLTELKKNHRI